jgi:hypothetical protein
MRIVDDRNETCILDSGSDFVVIDAPPSKGATGITGVWDGLGGEKFPVILDLDASVELAGFYATDVPSWNGNPPTEQRRMTLNNLFHGIVLTVDYRDRRVPIRSAAYASKLHTIRNSWHGTEVNGISWYPTVTLLVDSIPCKLVIDTGSTSSSIDKQFAAKLGLVGREVVRPDGPSGKRISTFDTTHPLRVEIDGRSIGAIRKSIATTPCGDGVLGNDILRNFRLTIDYPDGITYLEPYDKVDVAKVIDSRLSAR